MLQPFKLEAAVLILNKSFLGRCILYLTTQLRGLQLPACSASLWNPGNRSPHIRRESWLRKASEGMLRGWVRGLPLSMANLAGLFYIQMPDPRGPQPSPLQKDQLWHGERKRDVPYLREGKLTKVALQSTPVTAQVGIYKGRSPEDRMPRMETGRGQGGWAVREEEVAQISFC